MADTLTPTDRRAAPGRRRRPPTLLRNLVVLSIVGSTLLVPPFVLGMNIVVADLLLLGLVVIGWRGALARGASSRLARRMAPWVYVYALGHVLGLLGVGFAFWALSATARNFFPLVFFLVLLGLLVQRPSMLDVAIKTYVFTGLFHVAAIFLAGGFRSEGLFRNPNYAAHMLACAILLVPHFSKRRAVRGGVILALVAGIFRTGSFGAMLILLTAAAASAWRWSGQAPRALRGLLRTAVVLGVLGAGWVGWNQLDGAEVDVGSGVNSERFERSSSTRTELWQDGIEIFQRNPLGVGVDGVKHLDLEVAAGVGEIHNDTLDTLVGAGVPGVVGMFGIVATIWHAAGRGSRLRVALTGLIASSVVRQTWNFRHMWIFLAIALALEITRRAAARAQPVPVRQ